MTDQTRDLSYAIDDGNSNLLTAGLQGHDAALASAQRLADDLGHPVYIYEMGHSGDGDDLDYESVDPSPTAEDDRDVADWEVVETYVDCCYGDDGDEPGDCYTRIGCTPAGAWYVDDGDDTARDVASGPYATEVEARAAAEELATRNHMGESGEDAAAMTDRLLTAAAGESDPDGMWCVYWETALDDAHVVTRYTTSDQAQARANQMNSDLRAAHPGSLLCAYSVRHLVDGTWLRN